MKHQILAKLYRHFYKNVETYSRNPMFRDYVEQLSRTSALLGQKERAIHNRRLEEYLILREGILREEKMLSFYKIGVVRNQRSQVKNVAKHVGLQINAPVNDQVSLPEEEAEQQRTISSESTQLSGDEIAVDSSSEMPDSSENSQTGSKS